MNREDFPILKKNMIYFDNSATTLKPKIVIDEMNKYYLEHTSNIHRGDYDFAVITNKLYDDVRNIIASFVNCNSNEVVYTSGTTMSLNMVVFGYMRKHLKKGDEVLLTKSEHASNILPWFELSDEIGIKINYIKLDNNHKVTLENVKESIKDDTKVISIAHVTNVVGDIRPIKEIIEYAHSKGIKVVIDGAQSLAHTYINVQEFNPDFLVFSAHKMCGPTGVGVIYLDEKYVNDIKPIIFGGGMNATFEFDGTREYSDMPYKLEAGTPNIADIIAFGNTLNYLSKIGMNNIDRYEKDLRKYAIEKLKQVPNIIIYNETSESGIITFNIKDIFPQDLAIYLDKYNICIRAGNHCAKILKDELGIKNTCRISLYFYNTKEEIDRLVSVLSNPNMINEII